MTERIVRIDVRAIPAKIKDSVTTTLRDARRLLGGDVAVPQQYGTPKRDSKSTESNDK